MTNSNKKRPAATLRDGALKVTIWDHTTEEGRTRYSVNFSRSYTDKKGDWHDTNYFGKRDLLRVARLVCQAYDRICQLDTNIVEDEAAG